MSRNIIDKILAVVVIYNKKISDSETLISLGKDIDQNGFELDLFVFDNSPTAQNVEHIKGFKVVNHHFDGKNVGVSAAYNAGVDFADKMGKEWVMLLDQDTTFQFGAMQEYITNLREHEHISLFSPIIKLQNGTIFSPFNKVFKRGVTLRNVAAQHYNLNKLCPVNSGMMIRISAFNSVGGYNEKVKLDFSDVEFIRRFSRNYDYFKVVDTVCVQDFSNEITDIKALDRRYAFFCEGVKNCYRKNIFEDFQYLLIVLIRMMMLIKKTRRTRFIGTFYRNYLR